jgi:hypothetical protein
VDATLYLEGISEAISSILVRTEASGWWPKKAGQQKVSTKDAGGLFNYLN